jgi:hypothetical protein
MATSDEAKRAENEATFRALNERIEAAAVEFDPPLERVPFLCECDDVSCLMLIPLTCAEYEHVRADGAVFAVAVGHTGENEILEERETYAVIRKVGGEADVARGLNPRSQP